MKTIKSIIEKFEEDYSSFKLCNQVSKPELDKLKQFIQSSLTSLLDSVEKELRPARSALYANAQYPSTRETELSIEFQRGVNEGESRYRQEVINIINSYK